MEMRILNKCRFADAHARRWIRYLVPGAVTVCFLVFSLAAASSEDTVFGPKTYTRTSGSKNTFQESFSISDVNSSFTLIVQNGDPFRGRISSAKVILNGTEIVRPNDFNQQVELIRKTVTLHQNNTLTVELKSKPGSFITISIIREPVLSSDFVYVNNNLPGVNTVSAFTVDANGVLTPVAGSPFATGGSGFGSAAFFAANRLTVSVVGSFLFVANELSNNISVFSIDPATGILTLVTGSPFSTGGTADSGISLGVSPDNRFLFAATASGLGSDDIAVFTIAANGVLTPIPGSPFPAGGEPDGIKVSPDGRFLSVAFPFSDAVGMFSIGHDGTLTAVPGSPFSASATGEVTGLDINCATTLLFGGEASEFGTNIDVFSIAPNGALTPVPGSPFDNPSVGGNSNVVVLSPSERHLFVSNQDSNTITVFNVASDGSLSLVPGAPFANPGGSIPQMVTTNRAGTLLYVNNDNGTVSVFSIASDGSLTPVPASPFPAGSSIRPGLAAFPAKNCS
jgi:6-phosphogluconolactonase